MNPLTFELICAGSNLNERVSLIIFDLDMNVLR